MGRAWGGGEGGGGGRGERGGGGEPGGGGYSVWKRGAVLISYCRIGGLSESVQLIFHVK